MASLYIIRHKETHQQLFTSKGKKGAWKTPGHAKSAFTNAHAYRGGFTFDEQDVYEIVEITAVEDIRAAEARQLLEDVLVHLDNSHGYDTDIWYAIRKFLGYADE